jgi:hypothetical protein
MKEHRTVHHEKLAIYFVLQNVSVIWLSSGFSYIGQ